MCRNEIDSGTLVLYVQINYLNCLMIITYKILIIVSFFLHFCLKKKFSNERIKSDLSHECTIRLVQKFCYLPIYKRELFKYIMCVQ